MHDLHLILQCGGFCFVIKCQSEKKILTSTALSFSSYHKATAGSVVAMRDREREIEREREREREREKEREREIKYGNCTLIYSFFLTWSF